MAEQRSMNRVILVGNVVNDVEMAHIPSLGKDVADFGIATEEGYMDANKQWVPLTEFTDCKAWEGLAKKAERICKRGNQVMVEGMLKTERWEAKDGSKRKKVYVRVDRLTLNQDRQKLRDSRGPADTEANKDIFPGVDNDYDYNDEGTAF